jgi:hypothetical protein
MFVVMFVVHVCVVLLKVRLIWVYFFKTGTGLETLVNAFNARLREVGRGRPYNGREIKQWRVVLKDEMDECIDALYR